MFSRLFKGLEIQLKGAEVHAEARTIAQFYEDLADIATDIKAKYKEEELDNGFKKAAGVIAKLKDLCKDLETVPARDAIAINSERSKLEKTMGSDGLIDVEGPASKRLAMEYSDLLQDVVYKKYWPSKDCPTYMGQSFLSKYGEIFEERKPRIQKNIERLNARVEAYNASLTPKLV